MERIVDEEFKGIVKALPIQIKLDILKEDILEIYNYEKEIEDEKIYERSNQKIKNINNF